MAARKTRRRFSESDRKKVLEDVAKLGVKGSAEKHGVHRSCVGRWVKAAVARGTAAIAEQGGKAPAASSSSALAEATTVSRRTLKTRVAKIYTPSQRAEVLEYASEHGVSAASEKFGISRFSVYQWQRKVERAAAGQGPSPVSGPGASEIEQQRDREILDEWHKHPGLGPSQIVNQLRRKNIKVSVNTARRVMEDAGYRPPKIKRDPHDERYEAVRPNHLWHLDFVHKNINHSWVQFPLCSA